MYVVEIDEGVWLAPWRGDPGITLVIENARKYKTLHGAKIACGIAGRKYPSHKTKIYDPEEHPPLDNSTNVL